MQIQHLLVLLLLLLVGKNFTGLVKTATQMYPKQYIDEVEFQEIGDDITLTSNVEGHNIMAHAWGDKVRKCFESTHSTTLPGKTFQ